MIYTNNSLTHEITRVKLIMEHINKTLSVNENFLSMEESKEI